MRVKELEAKLLDLGVVEENDIVVINESNDSSTRSVYITIVSGLNYTVSYTWQSGKLVFADGHAYIDDIKKLQKITIEEYF